MFWKRNEEEAPEQRPEDAIEKPLGPIKIERDAQRPATILRVAGEFEDRGARILELFKEVSSRHGHGAVVPIHLSLDGKERFVEVFTQPWTAESIEASLRTTALIRASDLAEIELEVLSAYPLPDEVRFFAGRSPGALFQLDLLHGTVDRPEELAEIFREAANRHWGTDLLYETGYLPLAEDLLMAALDAEPETCEQPPILDALVEGLGCYLGEVIRRNISKPSTWRPATDWGDVAALEVEEFSLDPIGKARAFLHEGTEDSVAFYAEYVLRELNEESQSARPEPGD